MRTSVGTTTPRTSPRAFFFGPSVASKVTDFRAAGSSCRVARVVRRARKGGIGPLKPDESRKVGAADALHRELQLALSETSQHGGPQRLRSGEDRFGQLAKRLGIGLAQLGDPGGGGKAELFLQLDGPSLTPLEQRRHLGHG